MLTHTHYKTSSFSATALLSYKALTCSRSAQIFPPPLPTCMRLPSLNISLLIIRLSLCSWCLSCLQNLWQVHYFVHPIALGYRLFICLYLIWNCRFHGPLASSQALSPWFPMIYSQSSMFLWHWLSSSSSVFPHPAQGKKETSLKKHLYPLPSIITLQIFTQLSDHLVVSLCLSAFVIFVK